MGITAGEAPEDRDLGEVAPAWLLVAALAVVVGLSLASIGVDLAIGHQTAVRTAQLVDDSLRSVALADDLRYQAHRLSAGPLDRKELMAIAAQIAGDAHDYDPIATGPGERTEWSTLQLLFGRLEQDSAETGSIAPLVEAIEQSIARLVEINRREAEADKAAIDALHRRGLVADAAIGAVTIALAIGLGVVLVRSLRRQRRLVRRHVAAIDERSRELEAFAGRVAHDLRGPLAPIVTCAELLKRPGADVAALTGRIHHSAERMTSLIDDLLALSVAGRIPAGRGDVATVVREVLDDLGPDLGDAEVKLAITDCATACTPSVLAQLVRNVVGNAIKYRGADRPLQVSIDARPCPAAPEPAAGKPHDDARVVEIVVTDNGVGMTHEAAARAFDPFYRASTTSRIPGHGLGLAIVKRTVDAMGGDCRLTSAPNQGTRVTLHLPAAR
ncbi:MAG: HAMP domain-containing histidine kinase [Deltaproteobacteria bacterium]|nr:MAG: HAMP domain-containing histidine kinase [Deltaproteobacteria bacterium]TMQ17989.1 MAG: HAMP domain-containing histidine kinase [Deltaproteobacteria bacterium]